MGEQLGRRDDVRGTQWRRDFSVWAHIGLLSFGGPTAQIALMHRVLVEEKQWLSEAQYLGALSFCMLLPGPEAMQLVTYAGWRRHGVAGGLAAGLLFVLPGACVILALAGLYGAYGNVPLLQALFLGVKATVVIIVLEALLRIARRALTHLGHWLIAGTSFAAIFFTTTPYPIIVAAAAVMGSLFFTKGHPRAAAVRPDLTARQTLATISLWLSVWMAPLVALVVGLGVDHILVRLGWFFSKLAVVTFGGAYAVLAYMGQDVVEQQGWLSAGQMMDGLGLAETTPGPLILVTEFVGFLAAFQSSEGTWILGIGGALVALWMTFAPCFLWIFAGAPYIDWINGQPRLRAALGGITAAVVGVVFNLALWFALHVFFAEVFTVTTGPVSFVMPSLSSLDWQVVMIAILSGVLLLWYHRSIVSVLAIAALTGVGLKLIGS